jgi:hypothetical protein
MPAQAAPPSGLEGIAPVNTSIWAIAAGYLGLFSVLGLPAPFALVCGIVALRKLKAAPGLRGKVRAWLGIILGALCTVLYVFGIVAASISGAR